MPENPKNLEMKKYFRAQKTRSVWRVEKLSARKCVEIKCQQNEFFDFFAATWKTETLLLSLQQDFLNDPSWKNMELTGDETPSPAQC